MGRYVTRQTTQVGAAGLVLVAALGAPAAGPAGADQGPRAASGTYVVQTSGAGHTGHLAPRSRSALGRPAMVVTPAGVVHVAYLSGTRARPVLRHATWSATAGWSRSDVLDRGVETTFVLLSRSPSGTIAVGWNRLSGSRTRPCVRLSRPEGWGPATCGTRRQGALVAMLLDGRDRLHEIVAGRFALPGLRYRTNVSGRWHSSPIPTSSAGVGLVHLALDPSIDRLVLVYPGSGVRAELLAATKRVRAARFGPAVGILPPDPAFFSAVALVAARGRITVMGHVQPAGGIWLVTGTNPGSMSAPVEVARTGSIIRDEVAAPGAGTTVLLAWGDLGPPDGLSHEAVWTTSATYDPASGTWAVPPPVRRSSLTALTVPTALARDARGRTYLAVLRPVT